MRSHDLTASYKGVTITTWAERQPDGRFAPKASMRGSYRDYGGPQGFGFGGGQTFQSADDAVQWAMNQCMSYIDER